MFLNFIYRPDDASIRVWKKEVVSAFELFTTISAGSMYISNDEVLQICQRWLDDKGLLDVEYKVLVDLH